MKITLSFVAVALVLVAARAQDATTTLKLDRTISLPNVKGRIDHMAIDLTGQRLFIAALGNDTVEVVDLKHGKRIQTLPGFAEPQGVAYVPEFDKLFIANGSDGTCRVLDGHSFKTITTVQLGNDADNVRYDEKAETIYVGYGDGALAAIDAKNNSKLGDIKLPAHPESFRLETNGPHIFVNVPEANEIAVIDRVKRTVTATWPLKEAHANFPMFLDEPNHRLFVGCRRPARLLIFNTSDGTVIGNAEISGDTDDLFYDSKRKQIYVSCGGGSIDVIKPDSAGMRQSTERIPTIGGARTSFFSQERDEFYLAVRAGLMTGNAEIRVYKPR